MYELNYNIHNLLSIKIRSNERIDLTGNLRYPYFSSANCPENPDILLNIGSFSPSHEGSEEIAHKYYVKENYFYCKEKGNKSNWEIEIFGFENGKSIINFNGRKNGISGFLFPSFNAQEFLIPFIEYKLAKKNHFLIHGGAVCRGGLGFAFIGRGGVWKTTIIMDLMRTNQFKFLGEDRIILKDDGGILAFPRAQFVFDYTLNNSENEERRILDNLKIGFRVLMKKTERNPVRPLPRCHKIKRIYFVTCENNQRFSKKNIDLQEGLQKIILNNMAEYVESTKKSPIGQFFNYVQIYSLIFPHNDLLKHQYILKEEIRKIIEKIPLIEISMPFRYNQTIFQELPQMLLQER